MRGIAALVVLALACLVIALPGRDAEAGANTQDWGDSTCDGAFNIGDAINTARKLIGFPIGAPGCPELGSVVVVDGEERIWGDTDCGGAFNIGDAINIARKLINLAVNSQPGCPTLGDEVMLGAEGIVLDGTVPSAIDGEPLNVSHVSGDELAGLDPAWGGWFPEIGAEQDSFELSTSFPKDGSELDIGVIAITGMNDGFDPGFTDPLFAAIQAHPESGYAAEVVELGGISVQKVTVPNDANYPPMYYYGPAGSDTLWVITSFDESLVAEFLAMLPAGNAREPAAVTPQSEDYVPGSTFLVPRLLVPVATPVCVAEPYGRVTVQVMALDGVYQAPVPATYVFNQIQRGEVSPFSSYGGAGFFNYRATSFDTMENLNVMAVSPAGGQGFAPISFPIRHCLNGTWDDGGRVITVTHFGDQVTATWNASADCFEAGGTDFSGSLGPGSDMFSGSDLAVCNPQECVDAGLMEPRSQVDFDAMVAFDGNSIQFDWESQQFDLVYDDNDNLIACNPTETEPRSFTISRLTFGPGLP